jgi:hypothetical protein
MHLRTIVDSSTTRRRSRSFSLHSDNLLSVSGMSSIKSSSRSGVPLTMCSALGGGSSTAVPRIRKWSYPCSGDLSRRAILRRNETKCWANTEPPTSPIWVQSRPHAPNGRCPLFPQQRTLLRRLVMSESANFGSVKPYSITSSARTSSVGGTVRPSALAVLRLTANSNLTGACTGRSLGLSPFRIRSINDADRRNRSSESGPYESRPPFSTKYRNGYIAGKRFRAASATIDSRCPPVKRSGTMIKPLFDLPATVSKARSISRSFRTGINVASRCRFSNRWVTRSPPLR